MSSGLPLASAIAGALSALAFFVRAAVSPVRTPIDVVVLVWRARRQQGFRSVLIALGAFALAGAMVSAAIVGYFAAHHALSQMADLLIGVNDAQVRSGPGVHGWDDLVFETNRFFHDYEPFSSVLAMVAAITFVRGWVRRDRVLASRYLLPVALAVASWASVAMQRKFYLYHRASIVGAVAVAFAILYQDCVNALKEQAPRWLPTAAFLVFVGGFFAVSGDASARWIRDVRVAFAWKTGAITREEFTRRYDIPGFYAYHDSELVGRWLREHASPSDTLIVRGFETQIYELSGLHYTGRFCWSSFLDEPGREYWRREQWQAEDLAELRRHPATFAVAFDRPSGITSAHFLDDLGYVVRERIGVFVILGRATPPV